MTVYHILINIRETGFFILELNRVTQSLRQPGTAMKPIVCLAAFQQRTFKKRTEGFIGNATTKRNNRKGKVE
jgi:membrane carboxypeptidase/penicillin-binding protein